MSRILECFPSRFEGGYIVEADFSQLEVIGLAILSKDEVLTEDILSGKDMHCVSASLLHGVSYDEIKKAVDAGDPEWTKKRKVAKGPGFLIQYGGGAATMASLTGLRRTQCQEFIDNYYARYVGVKAWQDDVYQMIRENRQPLGDNPPPAMSRIGSPTGRRYTFWERESRGGEWKFPPTQAKNYPVQGFATGDIVPLVLGKLWRKINSTQLDDNTLLRDSALLVNTVHDSYILDVKGEVLSTVVDLLKSTIESTPVYLKETFGIDCCIPFHCDVSYGSTWAEAKGA